MKIPKKIAIDADIISFKAASAIERRYIIVTHLPSGRKKEFDNRTDFYGHWSKKAGGWLAEANEERIEKGKEPFLLEEFEIEDDREVEPVEHAYQICKSLIKGIMEACEAEEFVLIFDGEDNFRKTVATISEYKGNRKDQIRPLYLSEVKEYLYKYYPSESYHGVEGDDLLSILASSGEFIQATIDKDAWQTAGGIYDMDKADAPYMVAEGLGKIWVDGEGKIRAMGFKSLCFQMLTGDKTDNILPRALCKARYGEKTAKKHLDPLSTEKECLEFVLEMYKKWYPEPVTYTHWNGEETLTKDYFGIASEMFLLLYMHRTYDDPTTLESLCKDLGVEYER